MAITFFHSSANLRFPTSIRVVITGAMKPSRFGYKPFIRKRTAKKRRCEINIAIDFIALSDWPREVAQHVPEVCEPPGCSLTGSLRRKVEMLRVGSVSLLLHAWITELPSDSEIHPVGYRTFEHIVITRDRLPILNQCDRDSRCY